MTVALKLVLFLSTLSSLPSDGHPLKILLFSPGLSRSHVMFNYRLAATLTSRGHEVVIQTGPTFGDEISAINPPPGVREIRQHLPPIPVEIKSKMADSRRSFQESAWRPPAAGRLLGSLKILTQLNMLNTIVAESCRISLDDEAHLDELRREKFDIVLSHYLSLCPLGIASLVGVDKFVWISPGTYIMDFGASILRIPLAPSYIPNAMSSFSDRMSFVERLVNWALDVFFLTFVRTPGSYMTKEEEIFRSVVANQSRRVAPTVRSGGKSLWTMAEDQIATMLINGEQALDYPRPFLPGMMFLGQLENFVKSKELSEEWKSIVNNGRDGTIMFSLGTIANTSLMPMEMKMAFLDAFKRFPTYSIIWRLEGEMPPGLREQTHIKVVKWLPQRDLLHRGNVKLFITHGGYNSLVETAQAGVPMLLFPLFGDQEGNAKRAVRHGIGLSLDKSQMDNETIARAVESLLTDPSFAHRTAKLARFMNDKLMPNEDACVKEIEAIAKTRRWPISPARKMPMYKVLCLDIIFVGLLMIAFGIYALSKFAMIIRKVLRKGD